MPQLRVDFQEGWQGEEVSLRVQGREVAKKPFRTRTQIGLAEMVTVDVAEGSATVEVTLLSRGIHASTVLSISGPTYLAVSLDDAGEVRFTRSEQAFGYV